MSDIVYYNVSRDLFPPVQNLDFSTDCDVYGEWVATLVMPNPWKPRFQLNGAFNVAAKFMASGLKDAEWQHPHGRNVTEMQFWSQLNQWYFEQWFWNKVMDLDNETSWIEMDPDFVYAAYDLPQSKCPKEFCKAIAQTGNTDIAGIGIHTAYYVEAVLATMYLVAFTVWQLREHMRKRAYRRGTSRPNLHRALTGPAAGWAGRILDAFRGTLTSFLSMAMLLSLVMLIAAIKTAVQKTQIRRIPELSRDVPNGSALYDISLSLLASTFSVFPVMLIYALMRHTGDEKEAGHRQWMRRGMLALLWVLGVAEMFLAPRGELDYDYRHSGEDQFDCDKRGGERYWHGIKAGQVMVIGVPILWLFLTAFVVTGFRIPGMVDRPWVKRWRAVWRLTVAWINLLLMWGVLGYFTYLRHGIIETAGGDNGADQSDKWLFGQILALSTWAPTVAEWFYVLFFGLREAYSTKLPDGYEAIRKKDNHGGPSDGKEGLTEYVSAGVDIDMQKGKWRESDQQLLHSATAPATVVGGPMMEPQSAAWTTGPPTVASSVPPPYQSPTVVWDNATNSWKGIEGQPSTWHQPGVGGHNWQYQQQQHGENRKASTPWDQWESTGW